MRSRFAAFARGDAEYLWRTLHPDHEDRGLPKEDVVRQLREAARGFRYVRLTILEAEGDHVVFRAGVFRKGVDCSFVERSVFAHHGAGWRYLSGEPVEGANPSQERTGRRG